MSSMQQREGAWRITGRRCEPVEARLPQSDWMTAELGADELELSVKARNWAICDAVCSVTLVLILALLIGGAL